MPSTRVTLSRAEGAALEKDRHDRQRHGDERRRRRQCEQHRDLDRTVEAPHRPARIAAAQPPRQFGQQHHADRDADHAERKLVDAVGVIEIGDGARE